MRAVTYLLSFLFLSLPAIAGDDASGPVSYKVDLATKFKAYELTAADREFAHRLAKKFHYIGKIVHFVKTNLPLQVDGNPVEGQIYHAAERPEAFYVVKGDSMLRIGARWAYSPGTGGFSLFSTPSRNFLVCMNCFTSGVPSLSSSPVIKGVVTWTAHDYNRID